MSISMLACPWCGSADGPYIRPHSEGRRRPVCDDCGARGTEWDTDAQAAAAWNRVARLPALLEDARQAVQAAADLMHPGVA